jgi:hypothetical protein
MDGENWIFDQKISSNQEIFVSARNFILRMKSKIENNKIIFFYILEKKEGLNLQKISEGSKVINSKEINNILIRNEPGQSISTITFKLEHI